MASPFEQALVLLSERLHRAEEVIRFLPHQEEEDAPALLRVFEVAHAAVASLDSFTKGQVFPIEGTPRIALRRSPSGVTLAVDSSLEGEEGRRDVDTFVAALRRSDETMEKLAELVGLLAGLCVHWASVGFAPPVVLLSLGKRAPHILELGAGLVKG